MNIKGELTAAKNAAIIPIVISNLSIQSVNRY